MFKIEFLNGEVITEDKCKWNMLPRIPVVKLKYRLPNKRVIQMAGFKSYLILKEYYQFMNKKRARTLDTVNILGRYENSIYQFSVNIRKGKALQRKDSAEKEFRPLKFNSVTNKFEFGSPRKTNHSLWLPGLPITKPTAKIVNSSQY